MTHPATSGRNPPPGIHGPLCALLAALTLIACTGQAIPQPTPLPTPTPLPPNASLPTRILARGALIVGVRYDLPPFGYVTEEGDLAGFDVELGRELARRWLGDSRAVRFRQVRSDTAADHILNGDVDLVLTALVHTQELEEQLDFGPALFEDGQALLVRASDIPTFTTPTDLEGYPIGIVTGSEAEVALTAAVPFTPTLASYPDFDQALAGLERGEVSAVADLRRRLVRGLGHSPEMAIVGQYSRMLLAPAYAPNEPGMANLLALTLQNMVAEGAFQDLYDRWFPGDTAPTIEVWPGAATTTLEAMQDAPGVMDTVSAIRSRGRLQVAIVAGHFPLANLDGAGEATGYEVHLVRQMAERWLGDRTAVDFLPATLEEGLRMVAQGQADLLIGAVAHTREAELQADFSLTTYAAGVGLMVRAGTPLGGVAGLEGQSVAAVAGTDGADTLQRTAQTAQISVVILPKASLEEAMAALEAGEVVAVVGERTDLLGPAYATPGIGVTADRLTRVPLAIALPPGDSAFRDLVNLTLQAMAQEGLLAAIYREWFDDEPPQLPPWPGQPTHPLRIVAVP